MQDMKPYSEDLRTRIFRAVQEGGISKSETARLFGVSLSSVKRYARIASRGESLKPQKGGGRPPKTGETTKKLLKEDVKERRHLPSQRDGASWSTLPARPSATPLFCVCLRRWASAEKTDCGSGGARRMAKSRLEDDACRADRSQTARVRG